MKEYACCFIATVLFVFVADSTQAAGPFLEFGVGDANVKSEADSRAQPHLERFIVASIGVDFYRSWRVGVGYAHQSGQTDYGLFGSPNRSVSASNWYLLAQFVPDHRPVSWGVELTAGRISYDLEPSLKGDSPMASFGILGRVVLSDYFELSLRGGYRWADIGSLTHDIASTVPVAEDIDLSGWLFTVSIILTAGRGGN
jgi:hypothetical protein